MSDQSLTHQSVPGTGGDLGFFRETGNLAAVFETGCCIALDGITFTMPLSMALDAEITGHCQPIWLDFVAFK